MEIAEQYSPTGMPNQPMRQEGHVWLEVGNQILTMNPDEALELYGRLKSLVRRIRRERRLGS